MYHKIFRQRTIEERLALAQLPPAERIKVIQAELAEETRLVRRYFGDLGKCKDQSTSSES